MTYIMYDMSKMVLVIHSPTNKVALYVYFTFTSNSKVMTIKGFLHENEANQELLLQL